MANKKNKPAPKPINNQEKVEEPEIIDGEVYGVNSSLNIRSAPEVKEGNVVMVLKKGTKLKVVDPKKAKGSWYRIIVTDPKAEGYAMKKFIKIV